MVAKNDVSAEFEAEMTVFKKKVKFFKEFKGKGTELISLYLPPGTDRGQVMGQLTEETSQSSNIKSQITRKNVQGALRKIINFLKQTNFRLPDNGMVIFCGNISEREGVSDMRLFTVKPVQKLKTKLYWCDSKFHLDPLEEMAKPNEYYAMLVLDKREATLALLVGKKYEIMGHYTSGVAGKIKAGGQCVAEDSLVQLKDGRVSEIRNVALDDWLSSIDKKDASEGKGKCVEVFSRASKTALKISTKEPLQEIIVTPEHRFFVPGNSEMLEEKFAEELKKGDSVLLLKKANVNGTKTSKEEQIRAQLLGFVTGDGYAENERIRYYESEEQAAKEYLSIGNEVFPGRAKLRKVERKGYFEIALYGKPRVSELRKEFPETFEKTIRKSIPERIQRMDDAGLAAFLKGLFDAEGYLHSERASLASASKKLVQQANILLLRFGIISSFSGKRVRSNPKVLNPKPQWVIEISDFDSLKNFQEFIGFGNARKSSKLKEILEKGKKFERANQIPASGKFLRKIASNLGLNTESFETLSTNFFRNERLIGFKTFNEKFLPVCRKKAAELSKKGGFFARKAAKNIELLEKISASSLIQARIEKIEQVSGTGKRFFDLAINDKENFIANSFFLHNSAHRFEQLRIEAEKEFYARISERANQVFTPHLERLKGVIVAGPGITKNDFLDREMLDYRLKDKILGTIDTSYTDESGIREVMQKSETLLKDAEVTKERQIINKFFEEIAKDGLVTYGESEVMKAVESKKANSIIISEGLGWEVVKIECEACGTVEEFIVKNPATFKPQELKCSKCASTKVEELEEIDYIDLMLEKAHAIGAEVKVISIDTPEGEQFLKSFGGLAAFLRYK